MTGLELRQEIRTLQRRVEKLAALLRLALASPANWGRTLVGERLLDGPAKARMLRAVDRARTCIPLRGILRFLHMSPSRFHAWCRRQRACALDGQRSCLRTSPHRLTRGEVLGVHDAPPGRGRDQHSAAWPAPSERRLRHSRGRSAESLRPGLGRSRDHLLSPSAHRDLLLALPGSHSKDRRRTCRARRGVGGRVASYPPGPSGTARSSCPSGPRAGV